MLFTVEDKYLNKCLWMSVKYEAGRFSWDVSRQKIEFWKIKTFIRQSNCSAINDRIVVDHKLPTQFCKDHRS